MPTNRIHVPADVGVDDAAARDSGRLGATESTTGPEPAPGPETEQRQEHGPPRGLGQGDDWLVRFHQGNREILERCYRDNFAVAERAIGLILRGVDRETVIHELFSQIIGIPELRRSFQGGSFSAGIATVARNRAIDFARRLRREVEMGVAQETTGESACEFADAAEARLLIERFRRDHLPEDWSGVFELRFLQHLSQRDAAKKLAMHRTTLAYREIRIRRMLRKFLVDEDAT